MLARAPATLTSVGTVKIWTDSAVMDTLLSWSSFMKSFCSCVKCWKHEDVLSSAHGFVSLQYFTFFTFVNSSAKILLNSVSISMLQKISSCTIFRAPGENIFVNITRDWDEMELGWASGPLPLNILASWSMSLLMRHGWSLPVLLSSATWQKACLNPAEENQCKFTHLSTDRLCNVRIYIH